MKIEILFPERCNLFGDMSNMKYLQHVFAGSGICPHFHAK